jgi:phosphoglycolate phosphatase
MKVSAVAFDLDGTLLDTLADLSDSMNAVLVREGYPPHPADAYRHFVGDGMAMLVRRALPPGCGDRPLVQRCMESMEAEYGRRWNCKTRPYAGVPVLLDALRRHGVAAAVLSNKPEAFVRLIIERLMGEWRFHPVLGARPGLPHKPDPTGALQVTAALGLTPRRIAYVGDSGIDMRTATAAGMQAIGAAWGFRSVAELRLSGASWIAADPRDLISLLE